jgi:hypothetical protein
LQCRCKRCDLAGEDSSHVVAYELCRSRGLRASRRARCRHRRRPWAVDSRGTQAGAQNHSPLRGDPLHPNRKPGIRWVEESAIQISGAHARLRTILDFPKDNKKDSQTLFAAMIFTQTACAAQNLDLQGELLAEYQAGVEGVPRIHEVLLKANPKDKQPSLDDLMQRCEAATLAQWVKKRADATCRN